jgi:hypothetical protein
MRRLTDASAALPNSRSAIRNRNGLALEIHLEIEIVLIPKINCLRGVARSTNHEWQASLRSNVECQLDASPHGLQEQSRGWLVSRAA